MSRLWHNTMVVKATVMVALIAYHLVPPDHKEWVVLVGNMLWLWKT